MAFLPLSEFHCSLVIFLIAYQKQVTSDQWNSLNGRNATTAFEQLSLKTVSPTSRFQGSALELLTSNKPKSGPDDPWGAFVKAKLNVKTECLADIERRSNAHGIVVRSVLPDGRKVVPLPPATTSKEASALSLFLGSVSFGVVRCGKLYSIMVNPDDIQTARAAIQTDVAAVCSKRLMLTKLQN